MPDELSMNDRMREYHASNAPEGCTCFWGPDGDREPDESDPCPAHALPALAKVAYDAFETRKRDDGTSYVTLKDDRPEWVQDIARDAHGKDADGAPAMLPDDWRYETVQRAFSQLSEMDPDDDPDDYASEFAAERIDVYTSDRIAWLESHALRPSYCDEATFEGVGPDGGGILDQIAAGQYAEAFEVYGIVLDGLRERLRS